MEPVYLDHAATTPLRDEVREAMEPYLSDVFGNPSSLHRWGREAHAGLERARSDIADALAATPSEIRFVRGGTESDNLAIVGSCSAHARDARSPAPLAVTSIEHSAVLEAAEHAVDRGIADVIRVSVTPDGSLDRTVLTDVARRGGATASVMWVNNETGLVLPVEDVVELGRDHGLAVHTDASQAIGNISIDLRETEVDLLTATGHKINGPRGMGILFVREGTRIDPILHGGGQERRLRPGTEDVAGAAGLAAAIRLAVAEQADHARRLTTLRDGLESRLRSELDDLRVNGGEGPRSPHVSSIGVGGIPDGEILLTTLDLEGVAVSGGSACHSGSGAGSHVIAALYGSDDPMTTVRFSFGRSTTADEVDRAVSTTVDVVRRLRAMAEEAA